MRLRKTERHGSEINRQCPSSFCCPVGMGCSAGVIAIGLAQRLLAGEPNSRALVVSTENITLNWYSGNERSMLIPNTLFRMGGAAILLSNRPADGLRAKYSLEHIVRVHLGADDAAYRYTVVHCRFALSICCVLQ